MARGFHPEIYFEVLEVIENGCSTLVQIIHRTSLPKILIQDILESLVRIDYIKEEKKGSNRRHTLTNRGRSVLLSYLSAKKELERIDEFFAQSLAYALKND